MKHTINVNINSSETATFIYCNDGENVDGSFGYIHDYDLLVTAFILMP